MNNTNKNLKFKTLKNITVIGDFTNNKNGRNTVTNKIIKNLLVNFKIFKINTGLDYKYIFGINFLVKIQIFFLAILSLMKVNYRFNKCYFILSGGYGILFEIFILLFLRLYKKKIIIHHHNFSYLNKFSFLFQIAFLISGKNSLHIVLCKKMKNKLKRYILIKKIIILSNIFLYQSSKNIFKLNKKKINIGFISNITFDKGIKSFFDLFHKLDKSLFKGILAGPFMNDKVKNYSISELRVLKNISYIGRVYGYKKTNFYKNIDILIFPTNYNNEAEPLVIYEAFSNNIPVISNPIGCISEMIKDKKTGFLISNKNFVKDAFKILNILQNNPKKLIALKQNLKNYNIINFKQNIKSFDKFLNLFRN